MMLRHCISHVVAILLCSVAVASTTPLGLLDLYQKAKAGDPDYLAAAATHQAGLKYRDIGRAGLLPSVSASVASTSTRYGLKTPATQWTDYDFVARVRTIQLTQSVFDWDRISAYSEGVARAEYAEAQFAEAKADLVLRVAQGYFNYLLAHDNVNLAEAQKKALAQQRIQAESLRQSGVGTVTDMEETRARHELAEAQLLAAVSTLDVRRRELEKMVGAIDDVRRVSGAFDMALPEPLILSSWLEAARRQNPKVISQQFTLRIAEAMVERARSGHMPSLNLVASQQRGTEPSYSSTADDSRRIGLQLSIPLLEGGRVMASSEQAVFQKEKARNDLESAIRDSQIKVSQAYLGVVNGIAQVRALQQAVKSSEIAMQGMEVGQRAGFRTNTDVLNAQQQLFASKRDLQQQRYLYLLSRIQLKAAVGTLDDEDVLLLDQLTKMATGI